MAKATSKKTSSGGGGGGSYSGTPKKPVYKRSGLWVGVALFAVLAFVMFAFFA